MGDENCTIDLDVYRCSDKGLLLPFVNEYTWPIAGRALIYLIGLLWCFLGVAIVADIFMCSIEKITSRTRTIHVARPDAEKGSTEIEVKIWNGTVANLTLMALGSSAPEILLSCIEIIGNGFKSGELGPSTIVGSAAFNLCVIIAVCVMSIPSPEVRSIRAIKVFYLTAFFSVFSYVWLIIILVVITPDFVDLWEAIITLLFFPILVITAYIADKDYCGKKKTMEDENIPLGFELDTASNYGSYDRELSAIREVRDGSSHTGKRIMPWKRGAADSYDVEALVDEDMENGEMTDARMREFIKKLSEMHPNLSEDDIAKLAAAKIAEEIPHNHLWYRINATRGLGGNPRLTPSMNERLAEIFESMKHQDTIPEEGGKDGFVGHSVDESEGKTKSVIEFTAAQSAVLESEKRVRITIRRYGKLNSRVLFKLETIDGTAEANSDYIPIKQTMVFEKDETAKHVDVEIIDDNEWEPDEVFFVKLALDQSDPSAKLALIGHRAIQEITIINDDEPGSFEFSKPSLLFKESSGRALVPVQRSNGADGRVTLKWRTAEMTAKAGKDYEGFDDETLVFEHGEMSKTLEIPIMDDMEKEKDEHFRVELYDIQPEGAKLGRIQKTIVTIVNDDDFNSMVNRLVHLTNMNVDSLRVDSNTWADQFRNAMNVNGGDIDSASHMDYFMHFLTFAWKLIFAIIPPVSIWGGWLAFFIALIMIGLLTAIIGDLASIFGCLVGLKDSVTAITFVALGTSLPDLFASKQAATMEKDADNSIGNVTGSNSVNVFLGLGLPWTIAAIYWTIKGQTFEVVAGDLGFSVVIYTICACLVLAFVIVRRFVKMFGGELGGPFGPKIATGIFFICLWILYVLLSSFQAYKQIPGF